MNIYLYLFTNLFILNILCEYSSSEKKSLTPICSGVLVLLELLSTALLP